MPRSGTSYVASLVFLAGVFLGERLHGPTSSNPRGHFEDLDFIDLHERMLRAQNDQLRQSGAINELAVEAAFEDEARRLIEARTNRPSWGWKDTRTGLFLDFWARLLPEARFVLVYRKPWEVIDSHVRRGDRDVIDDPAVAAVAWMYYGERLLSFRREHRERAILADVRGIAADEDKFLALLRERFACELGAVQKSPFEAELLHALDFGSLDEPARALFGEARSFYAMLEGGADLPSAARG
jgi:hypothetical protein